MENAAAPPAKEAQDDAEVVDIAKKKMEEKEEGEKENKEKMKEEKDEEKKKGVEEDTPRSLKTMSPSEKVWVLSSSLPWLSLSLSSSLGESLAARGGHVGLGGWKPGQHRHEPHH